MDAFTDVKGNAPDEQRGPMGLGTTAIAVVCITVLCAVSLWIGFSAGYEKGGRDAGSRWAEQRDALNHQIDHWQSVARSRTGR